MKWIENILSDYGRNIGIPDLQLDSSGTIILNCDNDEFILIKLINSTSIEEIIVARAASERFYSYEKILDVLTISDFRRGSPLATQVASLSNRLFFCLRIPQRSFSVGVLDDAIKKTNEFSKKILNR